MVAWAVRLLPMSPLAGGWTVLVEEYGGGEPAVADGGDRGDQFVRGGPQEFGEGEQEVLEGVGSMMMSPSGNPEAERRFCAVTWSLLSRLVDLDEALAAVLVLSVAVGAPLVYFWSAAAEMVLLVVPGEANDRALNLWLFWVMADRSTGIVTDSLGMSPSLASAVIDALSRALYVR